MVDNPTKFIVIIGIIVVLLTLAITSFRSSQSNIGIEKNTKPSSKSDDNKTEDFLKPSSYDAIVTYGDNGFVPTAIEIKSGDKIRFKNESKNLMQISSADVKREESYGDFTQEKPISKGYFFDLTFSKKGTWLYQNLNDKSKTGIVIVK